MLFDLFKKKEDKGLNDVKGLRDALLKFIKEELQKAEGGEGKHIKGINLFINADAGEKHLYEAATYLDDPEKFKEEIQRIADDFALDIPENWLLDISFDDELPADVIRSADLKAAIFIRTKDHNIQKSGSGYIRVLNGEAEKEEYPLNSSDGKINIGRESKAQVNDGFFRLNQIAFPGSSQNESNKFVSRQHAHIEWSNEDLTQNHGRASISVWGYQEKSDVYPSLTFVVELAQGIDNNGRYELDLNNLPELPQLDNYEITFGFIGINISSDPFTQTLWSRYACTRG